MKLLANRSPRHPRAVTQLEVLVAVVMLVVIGVLVSTVVVGTKAYANHAVEGLIVFVFAVVIWLRVANHKADQAARQPNTGNSEASDTELATGS
jgi:protein-S-isoprenylcysteine O-methyltransferase Ste14